MARFLRYKLNKRTLNLKVTKEIKLMIQISPVMFSIFINDHTGTNI